MPSDFFPHDADDNTTVDHSDTRDVAHALTGLLRCIGMGEIDGAMEIAEGLVDDIADARSFRSAGILTRDAGLVLTLRSGVEYQITLVRST